jgi:hypothetical protein
MKDKQIIEEALSTYDISVDGKITAGEVNEYEVPFEGKLLLDEVYSNQGSLLYNKNKPVAIKGVQDGRLILTVGEQ